MIRTSPNTAYCAADPVNLIDPTGMDVVYDTDGNYLGTTKEGFSGNIYIYTGSAEVDFSKYRIGDLTSLNSKYYSLLTLLFDAAIDEYAISKILTHVVSQFNDQKFSGNTFSINNLYLNSIYYDSTLEYGTNWSISFSTSEKTTYKPRLRFNILPNSYELTIHNIASSIILHEWLGHGVKHFNDGDYNHWKCYALVLFDRTLYPHTTLKYKIFNIKQLFRYWIKSVHDIESNNKVSKSSK